MNRPKSSLYNRAKRRADGAAILAGGTLLAALLLTRASTALRTAVNGSPAAYAAVLCALCTAVLFPLAWYRGYRLERQYGAFSRSFTLAPTVRTDKVEAAFADGVLTVQLPKQEESKPRRIAIS